MPLTTHVFAFSVARWAGQLKDFAAVARATQLGDFSDHKKGMSPIFYFDSVLQFLLDDDDSRHAHVGGAGVMWSFI
jgi:hypothetical protein